MLIFEREKEIPLFNFNFVVEKFTAVRYNKYKGNSRKLFGKLEFDKGGIRMDNNEKKKKEPWRIIVGIIAIAYIVYMWVEKDIMTIYTTMPKEQVVPLIATTIAVSLIKVAAIAGGILLIKWIISKFKNK